MIRTYDEFKQVIADQSGLRIEFRAKNQGWNYQSIGACAGLAGGVIAALSGSLLTAITWFTGTGAGSSYLHTLGTMLLFLTIPLLILGAHCLDLAEKQAEKAR
jgi:hypothetical protein